MGRIGRSLVVAVALAAVFPAAAPGASTATLTGKLTGAKLPANGAGVVPVAALRLSDGVFVAGGYASAGRFTLKTPPGSYAILASVVPFSGSKPALERVADFVTAKPGKRVVLKPTLKKRKKLKKKKRRAARRASAHAAFVDVDYTAIWVKDVDTPSSDPELAVLRNGMRDMLITDIVSFLGTDDCPGVVVERARLAEVIAEIKLQQSPRFDPGARVQKGKLTAHNATVTSSITVSGDQATLTSTFTNLRTGKSKTVSQTGPKDSIFDIEQAIIPKLKQAICPHTPKVYNGTFNGTWKSDYNDYTVTWSGSAVLDLTSQQASPPSDWPPGAYADYAVRSGSVHASLNGTRNGAFAGSCTVHGEADFQLVAGMAVSRLAVQTHEDQPNYYVAINSRGDENIPYTETGQGCGQQENQYPLTGVQFAYTPKPLQATAPDDPLTANTSWDQYGSSHFTSAFTFSPG